MNPMGRKRPPSVVVSFCNPFGSPQHTTNSQWLFMWITLLPYPVWTFGTGLETTESQQRPSVQSALRISFRMDTMSSRSLIFDVLAYSIHISSSSNLILKINSRPGDHWCIAGHLCSARCLCCTDFSFSQCMFQTHRTVPQVKQKWTYGDDDNADLHAFVSPLRDNNIFFYFSKLFYIFEIFSILSLLLIFSYSFYIFLLTNTFSARLCLRTLCIWQMPYIFNKKWINMSIRSS